MIQLKKCPCGQIPTRLFTEPGYTSSWANVYGNCCSKWIIPFEPINNTVFTDASYAEAVKAWNDAPREEKP